MSWVHHLKVRLIFHKVSFIINLYFPIWSETLHIGRLKLFAEASELLMHPLFQLVVVRKRRHKNASFGETKFGSRMVLNRDWRVMRAAFILLFHRILRDLCFNFVNVCIYRSDLTMAHLCKNSTKNIHSLSHKSLTKSA